MGVSILLGGFTTWLGVIPLAFSTTKIFTTVSVAAFAAYFPCSGLFLAAMCHFRARILKTKLSFLYYDYFRSLSVSWRW